MGTTVSLTRKGVDRSSMDRHLETTHSVQYYCKHGGTDMSLGFYLQFF